MSDASNHATFDEDDWRSLTMLDKKAIRILTIAFSNFEPLARFSRLGTVGIQSLLAKGLAEKGPPSRSASGSCGYRLTMKGWLANEWLSGNRIHSFPEADETSRSIAAAAFRSGRIVK